jgi:hypothetical protein
VSLALACSRRGCLHLLSHPFPLLAFQIQKTILNDHLPTSKWTPKSALHDNFHKVVSSVTCRSYRGNADDVYPTFWFHLILHTFHANTQVLQYSTCHLWLIRGVQIAHRGVRSFGRKIAEGILLNLLPHLQNLTIPPSSMLHSS